MTAKNTDRPDDDDSLGVLDDAASLDTAGIGILGGTAQVNLTIPTGDDDDLLDDDAVVDGEVPSELIIDPAPELVPASAADAVGRILDGGIDIIIEVPADELPPVATDAAEHAVTAEVVLDHDELADRVAAQEAEAAALPDDLIVERDAEPDLEAPAHEDVEPSTENASDPDAAASASEADAATTPEPETAVPAPAAKPAKKPRPAK
ncbi:MAG TPA: hypothetical protein VN035_09725, partial [Microbacterium sp.]|nr:hypothetical protein [Microbacterium sp.]